MSGHPETTMFIDRELSWLAFNERVLEEAADPGNPLLERIKFTAQYELTLRELLPALAEHGVQIVGFDALGDGQRASLHAFFKNSLLPVLTPLAIDVSRPFPLLSSLSINLALLLESVPGEEGRRLALVQVPSGFARLVSVLESSGFAFVLLEHIIRAHLSDLFPGQHILESALIRLSRDAELEFDDEGGRSQLELVERELRQRRRSNVVRLEVEASASEELLNVLREKLHVTPEDVYAIPHPLDLRVLMGLTELAGFETLRYPGHQPVDVLADERQTDLFSILDERDILLHHPYEAFDPVLALVAQAANDPDVLAIKQTLYRTSGGSPIIASLQHAAETNKQVTMLVELTARFDEERNIQWARALEEAGAHVIYGARGLKTHAKICLIVKRGLEGLRRYVHLGTGNYNERTARLYTDFGLMTTSQAIAEDATAFFSALTGYSDPPRMKKLVMAPTQLRRRLLRLIDRERRRAESGQQAEIVAKMNSLIDEEMIMALGAASQAGVRVKLNVRGICSLRPGVRAFSTNIEVVSIVDRFLEHSRIFYFLNGGDEEIYLSSADWMTRNLDKRVELMFPVEDPVQRAKVGYALRAMFRDTMKARWLRADGTYERRQPEEDQPPLRVQQHLQEETRRRASLARERAGVLLRPEERSAARSG